MGGAFVATDELLAIDTSINIWLHPPGPSAPGLPHVIRLRADVRWVNTQADADLPVGYGIRFCALTGADEMALHTHFSLAHKVV